jgi:hypothetical protein
MTIEDEQRRVCFRIGAIFVPASSGKKLGIALNVRDGLTPLNGLRHVPEGDTTGWYIWAGDELATHPDFFRPLHVAHLDEWCPGIIKYLGLPPGWRFLVAPDHEDVWFDKDLLETREDRG